MSSEGYTQGYSTLTEEEKKVMYIDGYDVLTDDEKKLFNYHMPLYQSRNSFEVSFLAVRKANHTNEPKNAVLVVRFKKQDHEGFHYVTSDGEYY